MSEQVKSMDILEIMQIAPHRYPFLLIDRITEYEDGKYAKGYKNVTMNEPFFQGHFPENPIMPGVLQIEALAQLSGGIMAYVPEFKGKLILFAGIDSARFKNIVRPGDRLDMEVEIVKIKGPVIKAKGKSFVNGKLTVEAELMFSVINR